MRGNVGVVLERQFTRASRGKAHTRMTEERPRAGIGVKLGVRRTPRYMRLNQIKIEFVPEQDRLLMRLATDSGAEVLVWLTRRCVKRLWPLLMNMAQASPEIAVHPNPEARLALVGFQHERVVRSADFSKPYQEIVRERPLGQSPLLISRIQPRRDRQGRQVLGLLPTVGQGVHLTLDDNLLHGLIKLIQNAVTRADWDLDLRVPAAGITPTASEEGGRPTIN